MVAVVEYDTLAQRWTLMKYGCVGAVGSSMVEGSQSLVCGIANVLEEHGWLIVTRQEYTQLQAKCS